MPGRVPPPELPKPALVLHVSPTGADTNAGSAAAPFATLERARDAIRALRQNPLPTGGVAVRIHGGSYRPAQSFTLTSADSGEPGAPILYQAASGETPFFQGGTRLSAWQPVTDPALLARLPAEARGKVLQASLAAAGIREVPPLRLGGFGSGRGFHSTPSVTLYQNDRELPLARWPNKGTVVVEAVTERDDHQIHGIPGSKAGSFTCATGRLARWTADQDIILSGYWFWDWADSRELVKSIDPARHAITLVPPFHTYGYRKGQPFYALNLFSEIDEPGEWYLDRANLTLYLYPPEARELNGLEIATSPFPMVVAEHLAQVHFQGITWDLSAGDGIRITDSNHVVIEGCTLSRLGGDAISIIGGTDCGVLASDIRSTGRGGVILRGGNRKTITPACHFVENCHISDLSHVDRTYTPAILIEGVGCRVAHNLIHDVPSSAMRVGGNEHVIEFNEICRVVLESDDQGAVDMWGDPTFRGNVFRHNLWHHIGEATEPGAAPKLGRAGIRLDDAISGQRIEHNIFHRCGGGQVGFGAIQIHGGKDNLIDSNLFVACPTAVSFSPWQEARWRDFLKDKFPSPALDQDLYLARYPALANLADGPNTNELRHNVAIGCDKFLLRNPPNLRDEGNVVEPAQSPPPAQPVTPADLRRAGIDPAAAAVIGLYQDKWRPQVAAAPVSGGLPTAQQREGVR